MLEAVRAAEQNYDMYDFDVTYYIDDELTDEDLSSGS